MALDDFDTHDSAPATDHEAGRASAAAPAAVAARKPANAEDEDLFDFPVVEMKFESDGAKRPPAASPPAAAEAPAAKPAPVASAPAAAGAPAATPAAAAAKTTAPAAAASSPAARAKPAATKDAPKSGTSTANSAEKDVAAAAQLVEDIEQALGSDGKPRKRRRLLGPSPLALAGIGALVLTNIFGFFFIWNATRSFQSGVQAMSQKLTQTLQQQSFMQGQQAPADGGSAGQQPVRGSGQGRVPLEASEKTTLQMAREEIEAGEFASARQRLSRLLAVADRIDSESRAEIEAEASFMIANTYRKQADAAREKSP